MQEAGGAGTGGTGMGTGGTMASGTGGSGPGGIGQCVETPNAIAADMTSPLGFSANDVLALVGGAHQSDLAWMMSDLYATHTRAQTQTSLTLTLAPQPTAVRFVDNQGGGCPGPGLGVACTVCAKRMEIDIEVTLVTGDGALNEKLNVTLKTTTKNAPTFNTDVMSAAVVGNYLTGVMPKMGYQLVGNPCGSWVRRVVRRLEDDGAEPVEWVRGRPVDSDGRACDQHHHASSRLFSAADRRPQLGIRGILWRRLLLDRGPRLIDACERETPAPASLREAVAALLRTSAR